MNKHHLLWLIAVVTARCVAQTNGPIEVFTKPLDSQAVLVVVADTVSNNPKLVERIRIESDAVVKAGTPSGVGLFVKGPTYVIKYFRRTSSKTQELAWYPIWDNDVSEITGTPRTQMPTAANLYHQWDLHLEINTLCSLGLEFGSASTRVRCAVKTNTGISTSAPLDFQFNQVVYRNDWRTNFSQGHFVGSLASNDLRIVLISEKPPLTNIYFWRTNTWVLEPAK